MGSEPAIGERLGFVCSKCGRQFAWRQEYQGKAGLTCHCGANVRAMGAGVAKVNSAYVAGHRARPVVAEEGDRGVVREWAGPVGLLVIGAIGRAVEVGMYRPSAGGPGIFVAGVFAAAGVVLAGVALIIGVLVATQVMGSEMDTPAVMGRKVLGIAVFAAAVAVLCASLDKDPRQLRGTLLAVHAVLLIYFAGLTYLMRMDLLEGLMAAVIAVAVQVGLFVAVAQALPIMVGKLLFGG